MEAAEHCSVCLFPSIVSSYPVFTFGIPLRSSSSHYAHDSYPSSPAPPPFSLPQSIFCCSVLTTGGGHRQVRSIYGWWANLSRCISTWSRCTMTTGRFGNGGRTAPLDSHIWTRFTRLPRTRTLSYLNPKTSLCTTIYCVFMPALPICCEFGDSSDLMLQ